MNPGTAYEFILLALCLWREARGELSTTKLAVAWSIRNRVANPGWWGKTWAEVILAPWQYSSFNHNDPNATKWPAELDPSWQDSLTVASQVYSDDLHDAPILPDPTDGATSYYDMSMDTDPPSWAVDGSQVHVCDWGRLHFYKNVSA
jgi:N-acetylmuramoyl-L-alanine amidase